MPLTVPPFEVLQAPPNWRAVDFISDLHLQASEPATLAVWQHYLHTTPADAVFILGDLFEVWVGDDALQDTRSFETQACTALHSAAQRLPLFFMQGNRDFLAGPAFAAHCGITAIADPTVLEFAGERCVLSHGDRLCLDDVDYQRFRALARSDAWQSAFLAQPLAQRRVLAQGMRSQSTARKQSGATYADVDGPAAIAWLNAAGATRLIHGHTHRPADHALAPGLQRVVLSDWEAGAQPPRLEVLRWSPQGLERVRLAPM